MKLDKNMLEALSKQSDAELWESIVSLGASKGFKLPKETPAPAEMAKLREMMKNPEKISMAQAIRLLNQYKKSR